MTVLRRLAFMTVVWLAALVLISSSVAVAQDDAANDQEAPAEVTRYGDAELIETLREYGLLDEWIAASPVSPEASLLLVTGSGGYQAQRQVFLNSLETWAARTELVRAEVGRLDAAQANTDAIRAAVAQARDALVPDDRLATNSKSLVAINDALLQLEGLVIPAPPSEPSEVPLVLAETQLGELRDFAETELTALNGSEQAILISGAAAFTGFDDLQLGLAATDQFIERGRRQVRPALEASERLVASALAQIPNLHVARMLGSTDVDGLSVVTVDAYIRAAQRSSCSVDWALLAGIGRIESNHGRLGGASVSRSGQVSTTILGPLLDGGESQSESEREVREAAQAAAAERALTAQLGVQAAFAKTPASLSSHIVAQLSLAGEEIEEGNGFDVVVDSDQGRLDGNEEWDRAVGPMQFLPETWSKWAIDGNGDGVASPNNLYDAAAAASRFLCHLSASRGPSPSSYVLGYNQSTSYVRTVLAAAQNLRARSLPAG